MIRTYPENMIDKMVEELKETSAPTFIWGASSWEERL